MIYSIENYKILAERFNKQSLTGKLLLIKNNPQLFTLEIDDWNVRLRLEEEAMKLELDMLFSFPDTLSFDLMRDIFKLVGINIKPLK
jgi:hypothetical protein